MINSEFLEIMKNFLEEEYDDFILSYEKKYEKSYSLNLEKLKLIHSLAIDEESINNCLEFCLDNDKVAWNNSGYYVSEEKSQSMTSHPYYHAGLYYFQEASAMAPVNEMPIEKGMRILDLCAAPGGKTLQIASKVGVDGLLVSNDISVSRQRATLRNIEKFAYRNVIVMAESPKKIAKSFPGFFDMILVDAPCSGEGMFVKDKKIARNWHKGINREFSDKQITILNDIYPALKPKGKIMYSTCTFSVIENEDTVESFIKEHSHFNLTNIKRLWPHKDRALGHFMALIQNSDEAYPNLDKFKISGLENSKIQPQLGIIKKEYLDLLYAFCDKIGLDLNMVFSGFDISRLRLYGRKLSYITSYEPADKSLRILRNGLLLGEFDRGKFLPSQAFAMYIKPNYIGNKINFNSRNINVIKFLKGESLAIKADKGYILLCVDNLPFSWGVSDSNKIKNKYKRDWII